MYPFMEGGLAQLVEHWSNKPEVAGSIPAVTIPSFFLLRFFFFFQIFALRT